MPCVVVVQLIATTREVNLRLGTKTMRLCLYATLQIRDRDND